MSFTAYKKYIEVGDTVILFLGYDNMLQMTVEKGKTHQTRFGALHHGDMIGKPYGGKVQCSRGWLYVLQPSPELWTVTLPHRTQILYSTDVSLITLQLDLKPGCTVVEAGTGSGSLSHAILRTIAPTGHLHTFDFHEQRVEKAVAEFASHGFGDVVTCKHRDVCQDGFQLTDLADAVFLDLPAPWDALPSAKEALKVTGGRICSFSPCIEQVQRSCTKMTELGFDEVHTMECLLRPLDVRTVNMPWPEMGGGVPTTVETESDIGGSHHNPIVGHIEVFDLPARVQRKPKQDPDSDGEAGARGSSGGPDEEERPSVGSSSLSLENEADGSDDAPKAKQPRLDNELKHEVKETPKQGASFVFKTGMSLPKIPGHTGFLTFATLFPS